MKWHETWRRTEYMRAGWGWWWSSLSRHTQSMWFIFVWLPNYVCMKRWRTRGYSSSSSSSCSLPPPPCSLMNRGRSVVVAVCVLDCRTRWIMIGINAVICLIEGHVRVRVIQDYCLNCFSCTFWAVDSYAWLLIVVSEEEEEDDR